MKVTVSIKNESIQFNNLDFDFSNYGVYLISGHNGIGKTTIMKQIVFGNNKFEFSDKTQEEVNRKNRNKIATYIEQNPLPDTKTVREYIYRHNKLINKQMVKELMREFGLGELNMSQRSDKLSGGELTKINIIAGLVKDTPYIFMDEPTNNLDNESVRCLINVIQRMNNTHTFVIISHDPRLELESAKRICISESGIEDKTEHEVTEKNKSRHKNIKIPYLKIGFSHFKDILIASSGFLMFSLLILAIVLNNFLYNKFFNTEDLPNTKDAIITYVVDGVYSEFNEIYARGANLNLDELKYNNLLTFSNIMELSEDERISKIIIEDSEYMWKFADDANDETMLDKLHILSVPKKIIQNFGHVLDSYYDLRYLKTGRLPADGKKEVAVSEDVLKKFWNYSSEEVDHAIGTVINIDDIQYQVVGISYFDVCIISYSDDVDYGFFSYDKNSFEDRADRIISYLKSQDATNPTVPGNVIIYTKDGAESEVLNKIITECPAQNYYSYEYVKIFKESHNSKMAILLWSVNIIYALILGAFMILLYRRQMKVYSNEMNNIDNYYLSRNLTKRIYVFVRLLQYFMITAFAFILAANVCDSVVAIKKYIIVDIILLAIPLFTIYMGKE